MPHPTAVRFPPAAALVDADAHGQAITQAPIPSSKVLFSEYRNTRWRTRASQRNPQEMHHGLLSAIPLLVAFLGICIPLSSASATPRGGIDSATSVISRQRQQRGPQAFPLSPANRYSSPSIDHGALGKRGGIHTQELNSNFILHYHIFQVSIPEKIPKEQHISSLEKRETHPPPLPSPSYKKGDAD